MNKNEPELVDIEVLWGVEEATSGPLTDSNPVDTGYSVDLPKRIAYHMNEIGSLMMKAFKVTSRQSHFRPDPDVDALSSISCLMRAFGDQRGQWVDLIREITHGFMEPDLIARTTTFREVALALISIAAEETLTAGGDQ